MSLMYLYHPNEPTGRQFTESYVENHKAQLEADGWVDSPAGFKLPGDQKTDITREKAESMAPDELVGLVRNLGFVVFTPDEFDAELEKSRAKALSDHDNKVNLPVADAYDLADIPAPSLPENLQQQIDRGEPLKPNESDDFVPTGLKDEDKPDPVDELLSFDEKFQQDPHSLSKEQLIEYGNGMFDLSLTRSMKEETLISKIREELNRLKKDV